MGSPKILLLDEPFNGLDPVAMQSVEMIKQLVSKGVSLIISSHQVSGLVGLIDNLLLIHRGQVVANGSIEDIESSLGLDNRIELNGEGEIPDFENLIDSGTILGCDSTEKSWSCTIQNPNDNVIKQIIDAGHKVTEWKRKTRYCRIIVSRTKLEIEEIGMEIQASNMMPLRSTTEEE